MAQLNEEIAKNKTKAELAKDLDKIRSFITGHQYWKDVLSEAAERLRETKGDSE